MTTLDLAVTFRCTGERDCPSPAPVDGGLCRGCQQIADDCARDAAAEVGA